MAVPVPAEAAAPDRMVGDDRADDRPVARLDAQRQAVGPPQLEPDLNLLRPAPAHRREDLLVDLGREDRAADELQVLGDRKGRGGASEETQNEQGRHEPRHARRFYGAERVSSPRTSTKGSANSHPQDAPKNSAWALRARSERGCGYSRRSVS